MPTQKKLVYADDALKEILKHEPKLSFVIERVNPVDAVEVVHGRWESWGTFDDLAKCSVCGADSYTLRFVHYHNFNYCPNCGAKMDGGNQDG